MSEIDRGASDGRPSASPAQLSTQPVESDVPSVSEPISPFLEIMGRQTPAGQVMGGLLAGAGWGAIQWALQIESPYWRMTVLSLEIAAVVAWMCWLVSPAWRRWVRRVGKFLVALVGVLGLVGAVLFVLILTGRVDAPGPTSPKVVILVYCLLLIGMCVLVLTRRGPDDVERARLAANKARYFIAGPENADRLGNIEARLDTLGEQLKGLGSPAAADPAGSWRAWWRSRPRLRAPLRKG